MATTVEGSRFTTEKVNAGHEHDNEYQATAGNSVDGFIGKPFLVWSVPSLSVCAILISSRALVVEWHMMVTTSSATFS